jgi:predicted DNA-binding protein
MTTDITVQILREIRDGIHELRNDFNARLDAMCGDFAQRLDQTSSRLSQTDAHLERIEQGLTDLGQFTRQFALGQAKHEHFHTHRVEILEIDVNDLKGRVARLEERVGP